MQLSNWILLGIFLFLFALYLSNVAGRLDRLHLKVENARNALDRQLVLRTAICKEVVKIDKLNQQHRDELTQAVNDSLAEELLDTHTNQEWVIESKVTNVLLKLFDESFKLINFEEHTKIIRETAAASRRVQFALTFYNDAATSAIRVRKRRLVRFFRLFGRASMPKMIEFNVQIPQGLEYC